MRVAIATLLAALALPLTSCGEGGDNAVEAREHNVVELDGVRYRVVVFRELNPRIPPDRGVAGDRVPAEGHGFYGVFLRACNESDGDQTPTSDVRLEDAFGDRYPRVSLADGNPFAYRPRAIEPGRCLPAEDSAPKRTLDGAVLVYEVPFGALSNRPFVLELRGARDEVRRVQLDL